MGRPRFTVRRMLAAVAILAVLLGLLRWVVDMRRRSTDHQRRAYEFEESLMRIGSMVHLPDGRIINRYENENDRIQDAWASQLAEKYRRLANYPWLATEPDPPRPALLAHPRGAFELPARTDRDVDVQERRYVWRTRPPAWTFLWTWPRRY